MGKNNFIMYTEWEDIFDELDNESLGILSRAIMNYQTGKELPEMDSPVRVAFAIIKARLDRDAQKSNSGEHHWNWKGGITPKSRADRNCAAYRNFRNEVLRRDNYTCQCCGKRGGKLNVHHIKHFSEYEGLRFDPDNGITLCEKCHKEIHRNGEK